VKPKRKPTRQPRDLRGDLSKYPVDPKKIPLNMPAPHFHLITTGHLMAFECVEYGWTAPDGTKHL